MNYTKDSRHYVAYVVNLAGRHDLKSINAALNIYFNNSNPKYLHYKLLVT